MTNSRPVGIFPDQPRRKRNLARLGIEIVNEQHGIVPPVVTDDQNRGVPVRNNGEFTPTNFRHLLAHPNDAFGPIQQRLRVSPLNCRVNVLESVGAATNDRQKRLVAFSKAGVWLVGPLHWRACTVPLRKREIVAHADFIAVANHRRPRQCEQEAVCQLEPALVAIEHGRKPTSDAAVVELHLRLGPERIEHRLPLLLRQPTEVEFIVVAQEHAPLRRRGPLSGRLQRRRQRPRVRRCESVKYDAG